MLISQACGVSRVLAWKHHLGPKFTCTSPSKSLPFQYVIYAKKYDPSSLSLKPSLNGVEIFLKMLKARMKKASNILRWAEQGGFIWSPLCLPSSNEVSQEPEINPRLLKPLEFGTTQRQLHGTKVVNREQRVPHNQNYSKAQGVYSRRSLSVLRESGKNHLVFVRY